MAASRSEAATATASSGRSTAGTRSDDACGGVAAEAMTVEMRPPSLLLQMESMMMMQWLSRVIDGASAGRMMHDDGHDVDVVAGEVRESDASGVVGAVDDVVAGAVVGSGDRHRPSNQ